MGTHKLKFLATMSDNTRAYINNLRLKILNFTIKLTHNKSIKFNRRLSKVNTLQKPESSFNHSQFNSYKYFFSKNMVPLTGGIPSYYLSDIKPIKN